MRFIVQKVPQRNVDHLLAAIPGLIVVEDRQRDPIACYIRCLEKAQGDAFVKLEDDVDLCSKFIDRINAAVSKHAGKKIMSFFSLRRISQTTRYPGSAFSMFQCVYFPAGIAAEQIAYLTRGDWPKRNENPTSMDYLVKAFLRETKRDFLIWIPNLVQHRIGKSAIDPRRSQHRQSINFLGERL